MVQRVQATEICETPHRDASLRISSVSPQSELFFYNVSRLAKWLHQHIRCIEEIQMFLISPLGFCNNFVSVMDRFSCLRDRNSLLKLNTCLKLIQCALLDTRGAICTHTFPTSLVFLTVKTSSLTYIFKVVRLCLVDHTVSYQMLFEQGEDF